MDPCDFASFSEERCHKLGYSRKTDFIDFEKLNKHDQEVYLWRAGGSSAKTICLHHFAYFGKKFYKSVGLLCCNVLQKHSKVAKG